MSPPPPRWTRWLPLLYLAFGIAWILGSDNVVGWLFADNPHLLLVVSTAKGFAFVALTALLLALWWRGEQKRTSDLVQAAEARATFATERLAWMSQHADDLILLTDRHGNILDCNDAAERAYGYTRTEFRNLPPLGVCADSGTSRDQFAKAVQVGSQRFESLHRRKDGSTFPVDISATRIEFEGELYLQSIVRDITARREFERRTREMAAERDRVLDRLELQFESMPVGCAVIADATMALVEVNPAFERIFGYSAAELTEGNGFARIVPADIRTMVQARLAALLEAGDTSVAINENVRRDGRRITCRWTNVPLRDDDGHSLGLLIMCEDITASRAAEIALQESEARYRGIFEQSSDAILVLDAGRLVVDANPEAQRMLGHSRSDLQRLALVDIIPEAAPLLAQLGAETGAVLRQQCVARRRDGTQFHADASVRALEHGRALVTLRDQTEIVAARRRIERQRDLYDLLSRCNHAVARVDGAGELYASVTRLAVEHGHFLFAWFAEPLPTGEVGKAALFGADEGYVDALDVSQRADLPSGQGPIGISLREGRSVICNRFLEDARTARWHAQARERGVGSCAAIPVVLQGRTVASLALYASEQDVFEPDIVRTLEEVAAEIAFGLDRLLMRRELQESRRLLQTVIDGNATPMYVYDTAGRALLVNEACARLMGAPRESLLGRTRDPARPETPRHLATDRRVLETGEPLVTEETMQLRDGERVFLSVKYPLRDLEGHIFAVGGVSTDITDLRRAQQQLADSNARLEQTVADRTRELVLARDRAEQADRSKTAFLSTVSHELRTPLNSIIGFTDIVLQELSGPINTEQRRHLDIVQDSSRLLLSLINEILDFSRIEAGRLQLNLETFELSELLRRRVQSFASAADGKKLSLDCRIAESVGAMHSDPQRVAQIVSNLLSNAIKFTNRGGVMLGAHADGHAVEVAVSDTGPGIAEEDLRLLFTPFVQVGRDRQTHRDGTGLGLAISRHLAQALGGDITVESAVGQGTRFLVRLPLEAPARRDPVAATN